MENDLKLNFGMVDSAGGRCFHPAPQPTNYTHLKMKRSNHPSVRSYTLGLLGTLALAGSSFGVVVDFDSTLVNEFTDNFSVALSTNGGSTSNLAASASGGIGLTGSGSVSYTGASSNDSTAFYKLSGFDFSTDDSVLTESIMFHTGAGVSVTNAVRSIQLGFATGLNSPFNGNAQQA